MNRMSFIRMSYQKLPPHQKPFAILAGALLALFCLVILFKGIALAAHKKRPPIPPMLVREGNRIVIPNHSPLRKQLTIKTIHTSSAPHMVSFPGIVEALPSRTVNLTPPLSGRLIALKVALGDMVEPNQVLAVISAPGLAQALSDRETARSALQQAKDALERTQRVQRIGGSAIKEVELAKNHYEQTVAEFVRSEQTVIDLNKSHGEQLVLKSPIQGKITALNYGIGSYITDVTTPVLTISNIKKVFVTANIPEHFAGLVAKELPVEVHLAAYPNHVLHGKINFVNAFLEPDTRRNKTRILFDNTLEKLQPNMFATVKIAFHQANQVLIPTSAIVMNNDTTSVFLEKKPWTFVRHSIRLGNESGNDVHVISGLKANDRIIIAGGVLVNDQ